VYHFTYRFGFVFRNVYYGEDFMKGFKGFDKDMQCRGFQFREGVIYETDKAEICESGFHFCENPFDVWSYYSPCDSNFAEVEALAPCQGHNDDSKQCTTKIKIGAKLSLPAFINASVKFLLQKADKNITSGDSSQLAASGDCSQLAASGNNSKLAASGNNSQLELGGEDSVGAAIGRNNCIKGFVGCWITLAEYQYNEKKQRYIPVCVKSVQIDGKNIKADTFYKLQDGEFVEVENEVLSMS
jgi:hypothetical protein